MGTLKESPPDQLRGATEMIDDRLRIERLVRANARRAMVIDIIERLVEDPEREDFAPSDMEYWGPLHDALQAKLRAALAEQEVPANAFGNMEPVAWYLPSDEGCDSMFRDHRTVVACTGNPWTGWQPLYTAQPRREWQSLTEEEMMSAAWKAGFDIHEDYDAEDDSDKLHWWSPDGETCDDSLMKLRDIIEAALKEKNHD